MRIHYKPSSELGVQKSTMVFKHLSNGASYQITLNFNNNKFFIHDLSTDEPYHLVVEGDGRTPHELKRKAKEALIKLDIDLGEKETRLGKVKKLSNVSQ